MMWYSDNTFHDDQAARVERFIERLELWKHARLDRDRDYQLSGSILFQAVENTIWN